MLKSIDILIGLSVVMLMVSLVVTVLTGAINQFFQTRGKNLLQGIAGLLRQIHPALPAGVSLEISKAVLTHPLIRSAGEKFGSVIHREELTGLLLELAAGEDPTDIKDRLSDTARQQLCDLLKAHGIDDPAATLSNVRTFALALEQSHPELSNQARMTMAFLQEANGHFLAKLHGWFDQTMDRVSDRFTNSTRIVTFVASFVVALGLQLDTAGLVRRLNTDQTLRQSLVNKAADSLIANDPNALIALPETTTPVKPAAPESAPPPGAPNTPPPAPAQNAPAAGQAGSAAPAKTDDSAAAARAARANLEYLSSVDVIQMPASLGDWWAGWGKGWTWVMKLLGIVLTTLLLSLGAPFWYNALKNLLRLRSLMAQKDDVQRANRQQITPPDGATAAAPAAATTVAAGERGDLRSLG